MVMKFQVLAVLIALFSGALLVGAAQGSDPPPPVDTCRYFGEDFQQGERICMKTAHGPETVECAMQLNNPSWKVLKADGGCDPVREKQPRIRGRALDYVRDYVQDTP